jgi:hypothetical protein
MPFIVSKKTNVFLIPSAYQKTPHECKGLHSRFARVFLKARERHERAKEKIPSESGGYSKGWNVSRGNNSYSNTHFV